MREILIYLTFAAVWFLCGYFYGYGSAMRYCTKRLKEMSR